MRALRADVVDAVWHAVEALIPQPVDNHPLGCHRPRVDDRTCFRGILIRLVTGCSWTTVEALLDYAVSDTTLRARRNEWITAGVFDTLVDQALTAYDRIIGLNLDDICVDGSQHKAPCGGDGTGPNCTDKGRSGWKWSLAGDRWGIPIGWVSAPANRNDCKLVADTLDQIINRGLLIEVDTIHMDRGYDFDFVRNDCTTRGLTDVQILRRRTRHERRRRHKLPTPLGLRWTVERTNSWLTNFGQLRRNTDRRTEHRDAQLALAITLILTIKLIDWRNRYSPIR